jgi:predicted GIY-YIG superfamily endonuclease
VAFTARTASRSTALSLELWIKNQPRNRKEDLIAGRVTLPGA